MGNGDSNKNWYFGQRMTLSNEEEADDRISNNVTVHNNQIYSIPGTIIDLCSLHFFYYNFVDGK